jgi:glucose dehydrogenase
VRTRTLVPTILLALTCCACQKHEPAATAPAKSAAQVDATRIVQADQDPGNWLTTGRTYSEQRFSPLAKIDASNVRQLGLAWFVDLDTHRGQEATPLIVDGILYSTSAWSKVQAIDAASGKLLWQYDPKVPGETGVKACCDTVNRGVAAYEGKLFVGTLDGRLVALDAATGKEVWSVVTVDQTKAYTIRRNRSKRRYSRRPPRPGTASGGSSAAAAPSGIRWRTTRISICCTSAPATARRGTSSTAVPAAATICS